MRLYDYVTHRCGCGVEFTMSPRADYQRRLEGREAVCRDCRLPRVVVVTEGLVEWWRREGFTPEMAAEICDGWPERIREVLDGGFTDAGFVEKMSA